MIVYCTNNEEPKKGIFNHLIGSLNLACEETACFLAFFNEKEGSKVIEIGSNDESSQICPLMSSKFDLTAIDLRPTNRPNDKGYRFIEGDFCDLPDSFIRENLGRVDSIYSISSIEHFGLPCCWEGWKNTEYDIIAMRTAWMLLKMGGTMYVSVPFGKDHIISLGSWRVYDWDRLRTRIIQDFQVELFTFFVSGGEAFIDFQKMKRGQSVPILLAERYSGSPPHLSVFLKMKKAEKKDMQEDLFKATYNRHTGKDLITFGQFFRKVK